MNLNNKSMLGCCIWWPKGPSVLMMINSCSYSTNDLVFNKFQIFNQDISLHLASIKDSKSSFEASTC